MAKSVQIHVEPVTKGDQLIGDISRQIISRVTPRLHRAGQRAVDLIHEDIANNTYVRAPRRRRQPGARHLLGSFYYELWDRSAPGSMDLEIEIRSRAPDVAVRVMMGGRGPSRIVAKKTFKSRKGKNEKWLIMPKQPATAQQNAEGTSGHTKARQVTSPGHGPKIQPVAMIERAMREVAAEGRSAHRRG